MKLGTIVYKDEIYNLDYMIADEVKEILDNIENDKKKEIMDLKKIDFVKNSKAEVWHIWIYK